MTDLPDVKIRAVVNFPAVVNGGIGLAVTKNNGTYTFDLDYGEIALVTSIPPASIPTTSILLWDSTQGVYSRMTLADFKALLASIS